jgi:hypothetical protein
MIRREFGVQDANNGLIKKEEDRLVKIIRSKIDKFLKVNEKDTLKNPLNTFNPLTSHLYFKTSFVFMKSFISKHLFNNLDNYNNKMLNITSTDYNDSVQNTDKPQVANIVPPSHKEYSEGSKTERIGSKSGFTLLEDQYDDDDDEDESFEKSEFENEKLIMRENK